jgi:DNA-binding MarR family transcriptional regulator
MNPSLSIFEQVEHSRTEFVDGFNPVALRLVLTLYRTMTVLDRTQSEEFAAAGLSVSQFNVLTVLHRAPEALTMSELAAAVAVRPTNLTGVVDTLCERGVLERKLNPNDRRSFLVDITDIGDEFLRDFLPGHWDQLSVLLAGMSQAQCDELSDLLDQLRSSVEAAAD